MAPSVKPDEELRQLYVTWDMLVPRAEQRANDDRFILSLEQEKHPVQREMKKKKKKSEEDEAIEETEIDADIESCDDFLDDDA